MKIALKDMEHIRQIYRQSPFVLVHPLIIAAIAILAPLYLVFVYDFPSFIHTLLWAWIILVFLYSLRLIIIWRLNTYVVTNQRILHYNHKKLFDQTVTETPHERVLNVSFTVEGVIPTVLRYGDVIVQVVGLVDPIILKNIDQPMEIKDYLWEMHRRLTEDNHKAVYGESDASHIQERVGYSKSRTQK